MNRLNRILTLALATGLAGLPACTTLRDSSESESVSAESQALATGGWVAKAWFDDHHYSFMRQGPVRGTRAEAAADLRRLTQAEDGFLVNSRIAQVAAKAGSN